MRWSEQFDLENVLVCTDSVGLILKEKHGKRKKWIMMSRGEFKKICMEVQNDDKILILNEFLEDELDYTEKKRREHYLGIGAQNK